MSVQKDHCPTLKTVTEVLFNKAPRTTDSKGKYTP